MFVEPKCTTYETSGTGKISPLCIYALPSKLNHMVEILAHVKNIVLLLYQQCHSGLG